MTAQADANKRPTAGFGKSITTFSGEYEPSETDIDATKSEYASSETNSVNECFDFNI